MCPHHWLVCMGGVLRRLSHEGNLASVKSRPQVLPASTCRRLVCFSLAFASGSLSSRRAWRPMRCLHVFMGGSRWTWNSCACFLTAPWAEPMPPASPCQPVLGMVFVLDSRPSLHQAVLRQPGAACGGRALAVRLRDGRLLAGLSQPIVWGACVFRFCVKGTSQDLFAHRPGMQCVVHRGPRCVQAWAMFQGWAVFRNRPCSRPGRVRAWAEFRAKPSSCLRRARPTARMQTRTRGKSPNRLGRPRTGQVVGYLVEIAQTSSSGAPTNMSV